MDLSRKVILASCVCAAFLAVGIGCMVEDHNIEEKEVFACMKDADCLEGSVCDCDKVADGTKDKLEWLCEKNKVSTCVREDERNHCQDKDGDGYLSVIQVEGKDYSDECGFSDTRPKDPDDTNAMIYPGAAEVCDGEDNDGDGCVDGTCTKDVCGETKGNDYVDPACHRIVDPCLGNTRDIYDETFKSTMCAVSEIGGRLCKNGAYVFARTTDYVTFTEDPTGSCPSEEKQKEMRFSSSEYPYNNMDDTNTYGKYEDQEGNSINLCDKLDNDCNGKVDEGCQSCTVDEANIYCVVVAGAAHVEKNVSKDNNYYMAIMGQCEAAGLSEEKCGCIGKMVCTESMGEPTCMKGDITLTVDAVKQNAEAGEVGGFDWRCSGFSEDWNN